jgi:membrane metallo-endopeptidase-like protein 1
MAVGADDRNSELYVILLDQPVLGLPSRDYFLRGRDDKTIATYGEFAVETAVALGADRGRATSEMADMIDFEIELANITVPEENRRDAEVMYQKMTIADLYNNVTREFDWLRYLQGLFGSVDLAINNTEQVVVYSTAYFEQFGILINRTSKRTLANYVTWHIVMNRINNLPQSFINLRRNYNKAVHGIDQEQSRWRTCVNYVNENFGMAVGRIFVEAHFNEEAKANALEMIDNIRSAFAELLEEAPWMDQETRVVAQEKADAIKEKIGYPEYIMNDTALNADYEGIEIDPYKYFENVQTSILFSTKTQLKALRKPVDKNRWSTAPAVVNAFYSSTKNQIMFPAGILQPPFYHGSYPKSMNYGAIAMVIGHELSHAFDDRGRQYDKDGNLKQWWSSGVIDRFKEKAQCIIDQYSNYTVEEAGLNLNGKQTQGENIADNGGLKQAFRAYKRWVERSKTVEYLLPGISLTHEQLFYLNFAQIWCGTARPESYVQSTRAGRHSPGRFRVIGSVSNSYDFARAYSCPIGSKMNPINKCSVW